eukprot:4579327-Prymnesium_polylepis.1
MTSPTAVNSVAQNASHVAAAAAGASAELLARDGCVVEGRVAWRSAGAQRGDGRQGLRRRCGARAADVAPRSLARRSLTLTERSSARQP